MKITNVDNIYNYLKHSKYIGKGKTAYSFLMPNGKTIKIFKNNYYKNRLFNYFDDIINHFEGISLLKNDTFIVPEEALVLNGNLVGYIYEYVNAKVLKNMSYGVKISSLMSTYDKLAEDTLDISNKKFSLYDLHDKNMTFNKKFNILDLDQGEFSNKPTNEIFKYNILEINETIIRALFGVPPYEEIYFNNYDLNKLYIKSIHYDYYAIKELFKELSEYANVSTKLDIRAKKRSLIYTEINTYYRVD